MHDRRSFLRNALAATAGAVYLPSSTMAASASYPRPALAQAPASPYGVIEGREVDQNGLLLPPGFTSRIIARSGEAVGATGYIWPANPDGAATFPAGDGGWFHVVNSESPAAIGGGASTIHFDADGTVLGAWRVLGETDANCAGGPTPWGTWLSCEEHDDGLVWECDPSRPGQGVARPALGRFKHEAVAVDPARQHLYLTEDVGDGGLYRFVPDAWPSLESGQLEIAVVAPSGSVRYEAIADPDARTDRTRYQVGDATRFSGGEGIWYADDTVWFTTKGDHSVWELDVATQRLRRVWQGRPGDAVQGVLTHVDNIVAEAGSGDLIVAEDGGNMELVLITPEGAVAPFVRIADPAHGRSEMTGPAFSPDGSRLYFSSQRGPNNDGIPLGVTYEISGPFRGAQPGPPPTPGPTPGPTAEATTASGEAATGPTPTPPPEDATVVAVPTRTLEDALGAQPTAGASGETAAADAASTQPETPEPSATNQLTQPDADDSAAAAENSAATGSEDQGGKLLAFGAGTIAVAAAAGTALWLRIRPQPAGRTSALQPDKPPRVAETLDAGDESSD